MGMDDITLVNWIYCTVILICHAILLCRIDQVRDEIKELREVLEGVDV
jgi:hypothetical protein